MKTAAFATLFAYAATSFASSETFQLGASSPAGSLSPLSFIEASTEAGVGKKLLGTSGDISAPISISNGLLVSDSYTASFDGGLVTFSESSGSVSFPGNVSVNEQGVVSTNGHVQDWYLCQLGDHQALAYGKHSHLNCEEVTLFAEAEKEAETVTIHASPAEKTIIIFGNEYPAPRNDLPISVFWVGVTKALLSLFGTMGLGGIVAYRGLQENAWKQAKKDAEKTVRFAE